MAGTARAARALELAGVTTVRRGRFDAALGHNLADLRLTTDGVTRTAPLLTFFDQSGGLERWGHPTSEPLIENDVLCQYFQRGVLEWASVPGGFAVTRRLSWDFLGGGLDGSPDLGVEPDVTNPNPGRVEGPFGHRVSNWAVDGTPTGFRDFFDRLGGVASFGYPKTEARLDNGAPGSVASEAASPGFIRQYFQAAVLELHRGAVDSVRLSLIGDALRDRLYPAGLWTLIRSFARAEPLAAGDAIKLETLERRSGPVAPGQPQPPAGYDGAVYAATGEAGLPAALAFHPDGRLFVCVNGNAVLAYAGGGRVASDPVVFASGPDLADLRGIAFSDDAVYVSAIGKIIRLRDTSRTGVADEATDVVTGLEYNPGLPFHRNNGIAIGPDGLLYIASGSTSNRSEVPEGLWTSAILRARLDGTGLEKFATGLRNPYDLAFAPTGELFCTDNGPDGNVRRLDDEPDELNHIVAGGDYGHPRVWGTPPAGDPSRAPVVNIAAHAAAVGLTFYTGPQAGTFVGDALIATWGPGIGRSSYAHNVMRVRLTRVGDTFTGAASPFITGFTRPSDIAIGPSGDIFVSDHVGRRIYRFRRR